MSELLQKVNASISRIKAFEPPDGYEVGFSGGKDSCVVDALAQIAGVNYTKRYRVTSVDPPELVQFIKEKHPAAIREIPRYADGSPITMWNLIPKKLMPPTRMVRYCCDKLKESAGIGKLTITGVRWAESTNRKNNQGLVTLRTPGKQSEEIVSSTEGAALNKNGGVILNNDNDDSRKLVEQCYQKRKTVINPIIDWTDKNVWEFIRAEKIPVCGLYEEGFHRLGCIGCPMAGTKEREREFLRWPKYKAQYIRTFEKMRIVRVERGLKSEWISGQDVFNWWMQYNVLPGQYEFEDML